MQAAPKGYGLIDVFYFFYTALAPPCLAAPAWPARSAILLLGWLAQEALHGMA